MGINKDTNGNTPLCRYGMVCCTLQWHGASRHSRVDTLCSNWNMIWKQPAKLNWIEFFFLLSGSMRTSVRVVFNSEFQWKNGMKIKITDKPIECRGTLIWQYMPFKALRKNTHRNDECQHFKQHQQHNNLKMRSNKNRPSDNPTEHKNILNLHQLLLLLLLCTCVYFGAYYTMTVVCARSNWTSRVKSLRIFNLFYAIQL